MEEVLRDRLRELPLFRGVDDAWFAEVSDDVEIVLLGAGEVVFREGERSDGLVVVLAGTLEVIVAVDDGTHYNIAKLGAGAVLGEIALLTGEARTATVRVVEDAALVYLSGEAFLRLVSEQPDAARVVMQAAEQRLKRTQLTTQVVRHLKLDDLDAVAEIEQHLTWRVLPAGDWLFREGDEAQSAYLVASGRLRVVDNHDELIGEIGRGELVGEMAMLEGGVRNAGVFAIRDTQLVEFPEEVVSLLLERFPQVFLHLTRTILQRVRRPSTTRSPEQQLTVAVVPLTPEIAATGFAGDLAGALSGFGEATHLTSARVDDLLERRDIAQSQTYDVGEMRLVQWLHEVEDRTTFLVLECEPAWTPWTQRVVRQCDHVVFVGDAGASAVQSPFEREVVASLAGRWHPGSTLVLRHRPSVSLPSDTGAWLIPRPTSAVLHIREGHTPDIDRVARILAGRAVSLVLSGGGARGYAHIGVLQAMNELGIPIDYIGGTSIGAVIATFAPMGRTHDEMVRQVHESFDNIMDWTLPVVSVISGKRIATAIVEQTQGICIEDLWFPYFCVSASLTNARAVVHRRGPLATAVRASVAIPGVLPPVPYEDELLVDGGVIDNLPVGEARRDNPSGPVIAVDVSPPSGPRPKFEYGLALSGWRALRTTIQKRGRPPMLHATVLGSMLIASTRDRDRAVADGLADLYLPIEARQCGPFEWSAVEKISRVGYEAAFGPLADWANASGAPWRVTRG
jgi:predicted acylesterase/phospholipase RssA/CRP-like cAMP-binding protein